MQPWLALWVQTTLLFQEPQEHLLMQMQVQAFR